YLLFLAYHALSAAGWLLLIPLRGPWRLPSVAEMLAPLPVAEFVAAINSGNIASTLGQLARAVRLGGRLDLVLPELLRDYVVLHGLAALACGTWAVLRLRALALKEAPIKPAKNLLRVRRRERPPVGDRPLLWKEVHVESGFRMHWTVRVGVALLVMLSFLPAVIMIGDHLSTPAWRAQPQGYYPGAWHRLGRHMNGWTRAVGTILSCLMLLAVAVRAAGSVSGERDRQTFDGLIITPLDSDHIPFAKWLGSVLSVR